MEVTGTINERPCIVTDHEGDLIVGFLDLPEGDETIFVLMNGHAKIRTFYENEHGYHKPSNEDENEFYFNESEVKDAIESHVCEWIEERWNRVKIKSL